MLPQAEKEVLIRNYVELINDFPFNSLIAAIFSAEIIDRIEKSEIESKPTMNEKNRHLFDIIQTKPPGTFKRLCTLYSEVESVQAKVGKQLLQQIEELEAGNSVDGSNVVTDSGKKQATMSTDGIVEGSKPAKPYFKIIYKDVSDEWVKLAIALGVEEREIKKIRKENPNEIDEQCHTMLYKLSRKLASSFTKSVLIKALRECDLNDTVDKIAPMTEESLKS